MSGPEHLPPDDHELEDFLAGRGPHAARYRAAASERPPAALDALVLAQARDSLPPRRGGLQRWRLPLSLAATLVLGIGLVTRVQREPPPVAAAGAEPATSATVVTEASARQQLQARVDSVEAVRAFDTAEVERREEAARASAKTRQAEALERARAEEKRQAQVQSLADAVTAAGVTAELPPSPAPPSVAAPVAMALAPGSPAGSANDGLPAVKAAPKAALRDFAAEPAKSRRPVIEATATAPAAEIVARYRREQGQVLELSPGRYRLLAVDGSLLAEGERVVMDGGREQLQGLGGEGTCPLWLEPPATATGWRRLTGGCESGFQGEYREIEPEH